MTTDKKIAQRLRNHAATLRTKSLPLSDLIPLLCEAADALDAPSPAEGEWIGIPLSERLDNLMHAAKWDADEVPTLKANLIRNIERWREPQPKGANYIADLHDTLNQIADALGVERGKPELLIAKAKLAAQAPAPGADSTEGLRQLLAVANENDSARWEIGFRNIVAILYGPRHKFEIADVVERVREIASPAVAHDVANTGDEDAIWTVERAADLLEDYHAESHPKLPEVELVIAQLRKLAGTPESIPSPEVAHQPETAMPADNTFNTAFLKLQELIGEAGSIKGYWPGDSDRAQRVVGLANEVIDLLMLSPSGDFTHEQYIALINPSALKPLKAGFEPPESVELSRPPVQPMGGE